MCSHMYIVVFQGWHMCLLLHSKAGRVQWWIIQIPMTALCPPQRESACNLIHRHSPPSQFLLTHRRGPSSASKLQCLPCTLWRCIFVIHVNRVQINCIKIVQGYSQITQLISSPRRSQLSYPQLLFEL